MRRALNTVLFSVTVSCLLSACEPRLTIADARREAAAADELLKSASELRAQGKPEGAESQAVRAHDTLCAARDAYLSAQADLSNKVEVLVEFATLCERLRDFDLAGEAYLRAATLQPDTAGSNVLWYGAAQNFVSAGGRYLPRAAEPLDRTEELQRGGAPGVSVADIETTRGDISWKNGAHGLAAKHYTAALAADPQNLRAKMLSVCGALALGDLAAAGAALNELQSSGAPVGEGTSFDARLREAYEIYRQTRPAIPEDAATYRALAGISVRLGFLGEARAAIERALTLDDRDVFSWNMAGSLAHQAGDIDRARAAFARSLELEPNQQRTRDALAQLSDAGNTQEPK